MPIGRILLKSISKSKKLSKKYTPHDEACLLYSWLLPHLDVNGCYYGDTTVVNGNIWPRRNHTDKETEKYLKELESAELIILYEADGDKFLYVPDFTSKQPNLRPDHEGKPNIPLPTTEQLQRKVGGTPTFDGTSKVNISKVNNMSDLISEFMSYFNQSLKKKGWIKKDLLLTYNRRRMIESRLNTNSLDDLKLCVDNFVNDTWEDRWKYIDVKYCIGIIRGIDMFEKWLNTERKKDWTER